MSRLQSRLKLAHRYCGLVLLVFGLVQAASGIVIAFRWELEDASARTRRADDELGAQDVVYQR